MPTALQTVAGQVVTKAGAASEDTRVEVKCSQSNQERDYTMGAEDAAQATRRQK